VALQRETIQIRCSLVKEYIWETRVRAFKALSGHCKGVGFLQAGNNQDKGRLRQMSVFEGQSALGGLDSSEHPSHNTRFRYDLSSENGMRKRVSGNRFDNKGKEMIGFIESPSPFLWSERASDIGDWLNV